MAKLRSRDGVGEGPQAGLRQVLASAGWAWESHHSRRLPPGLPITKALWVACGQALTSPTFKRDRSEASQATEEGDWWGQTEASAGAELQKDNLPGCRGRAQIQEGKEGAVERETAAVPSSHRVKNSMATLGPPPTRTF